MEDRIKYYQTTHRLSIPQISELQEFRGKEISITDTKSRTVSAMTKIAELIHIKQELKSNDIEFISLKGPLLSWDLHNDFFIRISSDIDILIKEDELDQCIEVMKKMGYKPLFVEFPTTKNKRRLVLSTNNQFVLYHQNKKICVEVHWKLFKYAIISDKKLQCFNKSYTRQITIQQNSFTVYQEELDFIFLVIHGALHAWSRLKWLHDIYAYSKKSDLDWDQVIVLSRQFRAEHLIYQALFLVNRYWDLPTSLQNRFVQELSNISPATISFLIHNISTDISKLSRYEWVKLKLQIIKYNLTLFSGIKYKYNYTKRLFFRDVDLNDLIIPDSFAFLYFLLRPCIYLYKKANGFEVRHSLKVNKRKPPQ